MASHRDIEQGRYHDPARLDGFPTLAYFIGEDTDAEIFRRFNRLGARNLLYLQSIVNDLEGKLDDLDKYDAEHAAGNPKIRLSARIYGDLRTNATADGDNTEYGMSITHALERVELHRQIAVAIKEYRKAMIREQQVLGFKPPSKRPISTFRRYFLGNGDGPILGGPDEHLLDDPRDLVALAPTDDDALSGFLRDNFGWCCRDRKRKLQPNLDIFYFSESRIQLASNIISTAFCAILLLGAMAVLAILNNSSWKMRLGMVALFTAFFAVLVGLLTNARRAEIFASTAAYAAVLVVYVSGNLGPPSAAG
ncbi:hypothetical protein N431DRAFT_404792, partial [Stipitochalara longipes BDJ]